MSIGIDIGKYSIKIVELTSTNTDITVNKIGSMPVFSDINKFNLEKISRPQLEACLQDLSKTLSINPKKAINAVSSLPGSLVDIREISTKRIGKTFDISIKSIDIGLYNISLNTVQKEHILLFDNTTVFSDIIFDPLTGFRQARLKLVGWKTSNWTGDYHAPGFMFDAAQVTYWLKNTDYKIGDSVEYQGKFYVAKVNHNSSTKFNTENWIQKAQKPAPQLIPNFDYKISQFNDFYNLESNNFDESQQSLAQHLIGYQSRDYLENLFVNDVSQYKFYQGYIREKGTKNSIDALLNIYGYPSSVIKLQEFGGNPGEEILFSNDDDVTPNIFNEGLANHTGSLSYIQKIDNFSPSPPLSQSVF